MMAEELTMPSSRLLVSVVIPTHARPRQLRGCLQALAQQQMRKDSFEVIVVDDGSPEPLNSLVEEFVSDLGVRLVRQNNAGPAAARNRGVVESFAPLVAFTDDDCRPYPDWLRILVHTSHRIPGAIVGGATHNGLNQDIYATTSQFIVDLVYLNFNKDCGDAYFLTSNNILCPRKYFLDIGGFDSTFRQAGAEDRDFCDRWRAAGMKLVWRPDAGVEHQHNQSVWRFISLHYRYGKGAYLYHSKRRRRGTGNINEDVKFHRKIPIQAWRLMRQRYGIIKSIRIASLMLVWQVTNAAGLIVQACKLYG